MKQKRLNIVFATLFAAKQGVCRTERKRSGEARQTTMRPVSRYAYHPKGDYYIQ